MFTYIGLEINDTTITPWSASYLDLHIEIDNMDRLTWLRTKLYNQRDNINFPIVNFTFISSNIPVA
jgi:LEA14-like dessication related protein